ncbi:cyclic lactone autoinducer peptide [Paenibacillus sp. N3/727]|nr:cyclic lactone autoinducer peptide [Paenibacillus sp. N3/727]UNK20180.1 cyclic lactone autoinducer peptide [Paenibacillus sp. N3/727]
MTLINKAKRSTFAAIASALTLVAVFFVNVASPVYVYSGDTPEELLK